MSGQLKWYNNYSGNELDEDSEQSKYEKTYKFHSACVEGDLSRVQEFYRGPAFLDLVDSEDRTPIMCAVKNGHLHVVQYLLGRAGNIDVAINDQSRTTLYYASEEGMVDIVQWLLENGADPDFRDKYGYMPSYFTRNLEDKDKKFKIIKLLLEYGADVSTVSYMEYSPTIHCFSVGDVRLAKLFVEHKLDLYKSLRHDHKDCSPLHTAVSFAHEELVRYLIEIGVDFRNREKTGFDCLILACRTQSVDFVKFIWKAVYNEQLPEATKNEAIHEAVLFCKTPILKFLLDKGCDPNALNRYLETPLHAAVSFANNENAQYLLENGADANIKRYDGKIALHLCCRQIMEIEPLLTQLITSTRDINATDWKQRSPLHHAAMSGSTDVVKYLIDQGADLKAVDINKKTVLHLLCSAGNWQCNLDDLEFLVEAIGIEALDDMERTPLHCAAENGCDSLFDFLIERGANIHAVSNDKGTVLHHALLADDWSKASKLIALDVDVKAGNKDGTTPLHLAVYHKQTAEQLLKKGANIHATDNKGLTVLHYAIGDLCPQRHQSLDWIHLVGIFVGRGWDVNAKDKYGRTPLHLAYKNSSSFCIIYYTSLGADQNVVDNEGRNAMHYSAQGWYVEYVPVDINLNVPDKNAHRPIFYAWRKDMFNYLMDRTENIKPDEFRGYFPLDKIDVDVLKMIFKRGASVDPVDEDGNTMLHKFAEWNRGPHIEFLLEQGADVNARNKDLATPLHYVVQNMPLKYVELLVEHGADLKAEDKHKKTPLDFARQSRRSDIVDFLISKDVF